MDEPIRQTFFFSRNDINLLDTPSGLKIDLKGCKSKGQPGSPAFPGKIIRVALPKNTRALKVSETIERHASLTRSLQLVTCNQERQFFYLDENNEVVSSDVAFHEPDKQIYESMMKNPVPVVKLLDTEWVDEIPMAVLEVIPVRYLKNGTIELAEIIQVSIEVEEFKRKIYVPLKIRKKRLRDLGKLYRMVANRTVIEGLNFVPEVTDFPEIELENPSINVPADIDYLIITDNQRWDAENITPGTGIGDLVSEFQRLANWKQQRGLRTHVAKIEDIVNGGYGDFAASARDLQEVIRNFLKDFCAAKGVEWVLLGGDIGILPVRKVCGSAANRLKKGEPTDDSDKGSTPDGVLSGDNTIAWKSTFLGMRVKLDDSNKPVYGQPDHILTNFESGEIIPFDSTGSSGTGTLGWYFCTDDSFNNRSVAQTQWIRVNGPENKINNTMVWYRNDNMIPTDLYYSSLWSAYYNEPGKHDWDLLDNGLYGQHSWTEPHMDGVDFIADIGVARAPVGDSAQAATFVDKVIEYEQWDQDTNNPRGRFRKMLYVSANWGKYTRIRQDDSNNDPPADHRYYANPASGYALINTKEAWSESDQKLICEISDTNRKIIHYNADADASHPGWYFAKSETDLSPSQHIIDIIFFRWKIPIPTKWIVFYGANNAEITPMYFALDKIGPDSSMTEQETLRKWMKSNYYKINQVQRLYTDETDLNPMDMSDGSLRHLTAENLEFALNEGPHFVSLSGHGNSDWVAYLHTDLVYRTTNGSNTSIMYADSCLTNQFDVNDAVGENALKHNSGGAVAYIGNTRYSWVGLGDDFRLEFFKTMQNTRHLADLNDSRCYFADQNDIYHLWVIYALNVNGDPEMPVYRDIDDAIPRYIGNRNTLELHRSTCQWVEKMAYFNMIAYDSIEDGINAGHDGCYYCLRQYHTK